MGAKLLDVAAAVPAGQLLDRAARAARPSGDARARVRARLAAAGEQRRRHAAGLVDELMDRATATGPADHLVPPMDPQLLPWLRSVVHRRLYSPEFEALASRWLGTDPFGLRRLPELPEFLAGVPVRSLPAASVAPFLRRISLTRTVPAAAELTLAALASEAGKVSVAVRGRRSRRWGQPVGSGAPRLLRRTRIPHVVHGIWLGRPLPEQSAFWANYAAGARRYAGLVDFVVWTDIPRDRFEAAAGPEPPVGQPDPLAGVRRLLRWARENGILLVNVHEVFHARAPMRLHAQFVLEMSKQLPRGYASASDHLRVEIVHRFGGLYADGDNSFVSRDGSPLPGTLPRFFDLLAVSEHGFTMNALGRRYVTNDVIAAPAGHPAIALWLELARLNYCRSQPELFGGIGAMVDRFRDRQRQARYIAPFRTGRVHHRVLAVLGIPADTLPRLGPVFRLGSEWSWVPPCTGEPAAPTSKEAVVSTLARSLTFLQWQLVARDGNLYLSAVDSVVRGLPDPDAAWIALLTVLPAVSAGLPAVTSITDLRRNDDGRLEPVRLPPEAESLLDRDPPPVGRWLGTPLSQTGRPVWPLDERAMPARLRTAGAPASHPAHPLGPVAEVGVDAVGDPVGVWLRVPYDADRWREHPRFTDLPTGHFGLHLGTPHPDSLPELNPHPEAITALLVHLDAVGRPIHLTVPAGTLDAAGPLASRLRDLLGEPVHLAEAPADPNPCPQPHLPQAGSHRGASLIRP